MSCVRLKFASLERQSVFGSAMSGTTVSAKVKNDSPIKEVELHYKSYGTWSRRKLLWYKSFGNYDLFVSRRYIGPISEFAIKYTRIIDGKECYDWDNNSMLNYHPYENYGCVGGNVVLNYARGIDSLYDIAWDTEGGNLGMKGEIYVNNFSCKKSVGIVYSTDGSEWETLYACCMGNVKDRSFDGCNNIEAWEFALNKRFSNIEFAVFHNDLSTGDWFWDNNFGQNYILRGNAVIE